MKKIFALFASLAFAASLAAAAPANAAPAAPAPAVMVPVLTVTPDDCGSGNVCYKNWQNCPAQDGAGSVAATVYHRTSISGSSAQVIGIQWNNATTRWMKLGAWYKQSGGGGTTYWFRDEFNVPTSYHMNGGTNIRWWENNLPWASYSVNPKVTSVFEPQAVYPQTDCVVNLTKANRVYSW